MLIWLHARGAECSTDAMDRAAQEGHLEVVQVRYDAANPLINCSSIQVVCSMMHHRHSSYSIKSINRGIPQQGCGVVLMYQCINRAIRPPYWGTIAALITLFTLFFSDYECNSLVIVAPSDLWPPYIGIPPYIEIPPYWRPLLYCNIYSTQNPI